MFLSELKYERTKEEMEESISRSVENPNGPIEEKIKDYVEMAFCCANLYEQPYYLEEMKYLIEKLEKPLSSQESHNVGKAIMIWCEEMVSVEKYYDGSWEAKDLKERFYSPWLNKQVKDLIREGWTEKEARERMMLDVQKEAVQFLRRTKYVSEKEIIEFLGIDALQITQSGKQDLNEFLEMLDFAKETNQTVEETKVRAVVSSPVRTKSKKPTVKSPSSVEITDSNGEGK